MKDKLINFDEFLNIVGSGRSLGTISPTQLISGPTTTLFYDMRGSATYTSCASLAMSTLDRWRTDINDSLPLNRDQWIFYSTGTPSLVRIVEREKSSIPDHWARDLPEKEVDSYPNWIKNLVNEKTK